MKHFRSIQTIQTVARDPPAFSTRCSSSQRRSASLLPAPASAAVPSSARRLPRHVTVVRCQGTPEEQGPSAVEEFILPSLRTNEEFAKESRWVQRQVSTWLDEEYTPMELHSDVGAAAAKAYCNLRARGESEVGTVLLGLSSELLSFNFRETFTSAFEVSNKVVEMVMMRSGCEVCCTSPGDKERLLRVSRELEQSTSL